MPYTKKHHLEPPVAFYGKKAKAVCIVFGHLNDLKSHISTLEAWMNFFASTFLSFQETQKDSTFEEPRDVAQSG